MAKTPYNNVGSTDILSAHINGLAYSINNIEGVLNMGTSTVNDQAMSPVNDMDNTDLYYRIYESPIKGFTTGIVVKRNGIVIPTSEYVLQAPYGVMVFNEPQSERDIVTISGTHIKGESLVITKLDSDITKLNGEVVVMKKDIEDLKANGGGGGGTPEPTDIVVDGYMAGGGNLVDGKLVVPKGDVWITHSLSETPAPATSVAVATNTIDAFPIYVKERVAIDKIKIECAKVNVSGSKGMVAVYSTVNGLPHRRLAHTPPFADMVGVIESPFVGGKDLRLEEGIYWIARFCNAGTQYNGIASTNAIPITFPSDFKINGSGAVHGVRASHRNSELMPLEFPMTDTQGLARTMYTCPYLHIKKSYV